jgi:uncharacterized protein
MKVCIAGGQGYIGTALQRAMVERGWEVSVIARRVPPSGKPGIQFISGDTSRPGPWQDTLPFHDVIINLVGSTIFQRWTPRAKELIRSSRIDTTREIVSTLTKHKSGTLLVNASAVGYYGFLSDKTVDESSPAGIDFLADVSRRWEEEATRYAGGRIVRCRFGIVLGKGGGALALMAPLFRACLGAPLGSGSQWFPWIHLDDLVRGIIHIIEDESMSGAVNLVSPAPVTNRAFTRVLAETLHRPVVLPSVPSWLLKLILGELGEMLLNGQRVVPSRLIERGFRFRFSDIRDALQHILK